MTDDILKSLEATLRLRKTADSAESYVASLYQKGTNKILEKVGEEATEVIIAGKDLSAQRDEPERARAFVGEVADLWFHTLVAMSHLDVELNDVLEELGRREGTSGLTEKANR